MVTEQTQFYEIYETFKSPLLLKLLLLVVVVLEEKGREEDSLYNLPSAEQLKLSSSFLVKVPAQFASLLQVCYSACS